MALSFYKKFLQKTNNFDERLKVDKRFYLKIHWNEYVLINIKEYLDETNERNSEGYLTSHTILGYITAIRVVVREAIAIGQFNSTSFINIMLDSPVKETNTNIAYSDKELEQIQNGLKKELEYSYKIFRREGYNLTGVGKDPRIKINKEDKSRWASLENMRWYFENVLNCEPILATRENLKKEHRKFLGYAIRSYYLDIGGLKGIYRKWGVTASIDADVIMPLLIQLTIQTGLNVDSILDLEIDCFEESNPITGSPSIKYYKKRSNGFNEMHINLNPINDEKSIKDYRNNQAKLIKNTINIIIQLTKNIRTQAPENLKRKLFIIQNYGSNDGEIKKINSKKTSYWCKKFVEKYDMKDDYGRHLALNLRRFRSTKITDLVNKGIDIFEIQHEMGHKSIETTMKYIAKNNIDTISKKATTDAIVRIFANNSWAEKANPEYYNGTPKKNVPIIYKGFACDCINPFDPPESVKKLKTYNKNQACLRMNMCLFCENVLIFKRNLPLIWMYRNQIKVALERNNDELPNHEFYLKTLGVIEALFNPEESEFSEYDIEWAIKTSEGLDELVDPVTYIPILEEE